MKEKSLKLRIYFDDDKTELFSLHILYRKRRSLSMQLSDENILELRVPLACPDSEIIHFIESKKTWLEKQLNREKIPLERPDSIEEKMLKRLSLQRAQAFLENYSGPKPKKISIRNQKSRWGSYSQSGTLSINLNAGLLEDELFEYLMVHELCHIVEMNHGPAFWSLVEKQIPDYKERRKRLKSVVMRSQ